MWESRYRDEDGHTPDGVSPHPLVVEEAQAAIGRAQANGVPDGQLHAADLGSGAGRHALALAELGIAVTTIDFAASAHDLV